MNPALFVPAFEPFFFDNYNPISFSPVSQLVDVLTDTIDSEVGKSFTQILNYFARPIDYLIQTFIATPIFETYKHFHGISKCAQTNRVAQATLRALASPITYPARIIFKVCIVGLNRAVVGIIDLFIVYKLVFDIFNPQSRADNRMETRQAEHPYFFTHKAGQFKWVTTPYTFSYQAGGRSLSYSQAEDRFISQVFVM